MPKGTELAIPEDTLAKLAKLGLDQDPMAALAKTSAGGEIGLRPPAYKIEYGRTAPPEGVKLSTGLFTLPDLTQAEAVKAVLLDHALGYIHWGAEYAAGQLPICKSNDGDKPAPGGQFPGPCGDGICPEATWVGGEKPRCAKAYTLLMFDLERQQPFLLQVKRASNKFYEEYYKGPLPAAVRKHAYPGLPGNCCFETLLGVATKEGPSGTYFVPTFAAGEQLPAEVAVVMAEALADSRALGVLLDVEAASKHPADPAPDPDEDDLPF